MGNCDEELFPLRVSKSSAARGQRKMNIQEQLQQTICETHFFYLTTLQIITWCGGVAGGELLCQV